MYIQSYINLLVQFKKKDTTVPYIGCKFCIYILDYETMLSFGGSSHMP